ncbi:caspase family protein, partial [Myxococcota bacterium]|nr:caspase family protein [Myxococcota bacterium]
MIAWIVAALVTAAPAPDTRVAVVVGNNVGLPEDVVLRYAEADAKRMHTLLVESGGVEPSRAALVLGGTARDVERAIAEAAGRVDELARLGPVSMIVYVSSHADERDLHLEGTRLPIAQVRA